MRGFPQVSVVVFDVNETLSDMAPLAARFAAVGAPAHAAPLWFASLLRDGFALTAAGAPGRFPVLAEGALRVALADVELDRDIDAAVSHVLEGFAQLAVHADVPEGVRALSEAGVRLITLSNGAAEVPERLLASAGLRDRFERCLSVDDAGAWKPARAAYAYAAEACGVAPAQMLLAAVHPWDIDGAARAGLATAWIDRGGAPYPRYFTSPDLAVTGVDALAERLRP
jgi:2-haloacid dehalogenase